MNKKIGIISVIVVLLLLLVGGGAYLAMKKTSPSSLDTAPITQNSTANSSQGSLKSLFASGKSQKCTFNNTSTDTTKVDGTVYVAAGKVRGDFQTTSNGTPLSSHMIIDSQTSYIWTDMSKQGFKMAIDTNQQTNTAANNQGPNMDQNVNYSCQGWSVDNSVFTLPADITFTSFTVPSAMPGGTNGTGAGTSQCAVCDTIPEGANRDACKTQLHCQ